MLRCAQHDRGRDGCSAPTVSYRDHWTALRKEPNLHEDFYPHVIRLRGPWEYRILESGLRSGTVTVPGFWPCQGPLELQRRFNWVAKRQSHERVSLELDGCVGRVQVQLNREELGTIHFPWGRARFDVSHRLRGRNELLLKLEAPTGSDWASCGGAPAEAGPGPVGGILGGVVLVVESLRLALAGVRVRTSWAPAGGCLRVSGRVETDLSSSAGLDVSIRLAGDRFHEERVIRTEHEEGGGERGRFSLTAADLDVEPWWPSDLGRPVLYDLVLEACLGQVRVRHTWQVGFRSLRRAGNEWVCNGTPWNVPAENLGPEATWAQCCAIDSDDALDAKTPVRLVSHVPPERFYRMCDESGLLVEQDIPSLGEDVWKCNAGDLLDTLERLANHPSLAAWRLMLPVGPVDSVERAEAVGRVDPERVVLPA